MKNHSMTCSAKQIIATLIFVLLCLTVLTVQASAAVRQSLGDLPMEGRYAVSAAMGHDQPGYHMRLEDGVVQADTIGHGITARFGSGGVEIGADSRRFSLQPMAWGYGNELALLPTGMPQDVGNVVSSNRGPVAEWYVNGPLGLQQGFTIAQAPQAGSGPLTIAMALIGAKAGVVDADGRGVMLTQSHGGRQYRYSGLVVRDAEGKEAGAWLEARPDILRICVDDAGLTYPLYIDPVIQTAKLTASDGAADDNFGNSIAISGDTVVVGAYFANIGAIADQGAAYVFMKAADGWATMTQTAKLTASDGAANDAFGRSVAIDGDTVVVGAQYGSGANSADQGAAYVFVKPAAGWANRTENAKLIASDGAANDSLGIAISISSDTVVIGAYCHNIGSNVDQGAAYVFVKPSGGWANMTQTAKLTASDGAANDWFGASVAVNGDTVVVGAQYDAIGSNSYQGSAYVFVKPSEGWANMPQTAKLTASDGAANDYFGHTVTIDVDTVVIGALYHNIGSNANQGAAYVFVKPTGEWATTSSYTAKLTASDGAANDLFGVSVAISGDTVVVGALFGPGANSTDQGAAYVFVKPADGWATTSSYTAKLTASDGAADDYFGVSVAISGDTLAVGADVDDIGALNQGSAYIFSFLDDEPTEQATDVNFSSISAGSMTVSWTPGNGSGSLVLMKQGGAVDGTPVDGTTYTSSAIFGSGGQIGTGNYVVFSGSSSSVTVTGLLPATTYHVAVYEYNSVPKVHGENYLTTDPARGDNATKHEPLARGDSYRTDKNIALSVAAHGVLDNDTDPDNGTLTAILAGTTLHGALTLNADGSFSYTPDDEYTGVDSFTYRAGNGIDNSTPATVTIAVANRAPEAAGDHYTTAKNTALTVDASAGVLDNDTDPNNDALQAILVTAPSYGEVGLNADGSFLYIPDDGFSGTDTFTYKASDGADESAPTAVSINVTTHAIIANADNYTTGKNVTLTVSAPGVLDNDTDALGHSLTAVLVTATAHGDLTLSADGSFIYVPDDGYSGADNFTYRATDGVESSAPVTVTITVTTHTVTAIGDSYSVAKNNTLSIFLPGVLTNDTDALGHSLTAVLLTTASHGSLTLSTDGSFSYIPHENFSGPDSFTYKATDGVEESAPTAVSINVTTHAIIANADNYATGKNVTLTVSAPGVLDNDTDALGHTLMPILTATTAHGTLGLNQDGSFIYTPAPGYTGTDSFSYKVTDGADNSSAAAVTFTVSAHAITAAADTYSTQKQSQLAVAAPGVLSNDTDSQGHSLTALLDAAPQHGSLALSADGSFIYMPEDGFIGTDSFSYRVSDGSDESTPSTVTITVNNHTITAAADNYTAEKNKPLVVEAAEGVLANDTDGLGHSLTAILVTKPLKGTVALNADGSFLYIPDKRFTGADSFTYKINDGMEDSAPATVTITVGKKCPAVKLYGEGSAEVDTLRRFRDEVLAKTAAGELLASLYYKLAPRAEKMIDNSPYLRQTTGRIINMMLPAIKRRLEQ